MPYAAKQLTLQFTLGVFEGPLDLLLHLIDKSEVDIYDIPIARITDQYMQYMAELEQINLELAGEFLVMAATLLEIKSRLLLPKPPPMEGEEEGIDPREELVQRLLEYKRFKEAAETLREWEELRKKMFTRSPVEFQEAKNQPPPLANMETSALVAALKRVLSAIGEDATSPVTTVQRERITVRMKMAEIWNRLRVRPEGMEFAELFEGQATRLEVVVTFLALLELLRMRRIAAKQKKIWGEIHLQAIQEPKGEPTVH